jgi:hypothetical protein
MTTVCSGFAGVTLYNANHEVKLGPPSALSARLGGWPGTVGTGRSLSSCQMLYSFQPIPAMTRSPDFHLEDFETTTLPIPYAAYSLISTATVATSSSNSPLAVPP